MPSASIQANEVAKIERAVALKIRAVLTEFRVQSVKRVARGELAWITQKQLDGLVKAFAAMLVYADKYGKRRARLNSRAVRASFIDDAIFDETYGLYSSQALQIVTRYTLRINDELQSFTRDLVKRQLPIGQIVKELEEKFAALGVSPKNAFELETIARTQSQITYNAAKYREEQQDYVQDILWGYRYSTVGDNRVRDEHAVLEGVTLPKDDPFWLKFYPPNGWNCRCQVIPIFEQAKIKRPKSEPEIDSDFSTTPDNLAGVR